MSTPPLAELCQYVAGLTAAALEAAGLPPPSVRLTFAQDSTSGLETEAFTSVVPGTYSMGRASRGTFASDCDIILVCVSPCTGEESAVAFVSAFCAAVGLVLESPRCGGAVFKTVEVQPYDVALMVDSSVFRGKAVFKAEAFHD